MVEGLLYLLSFVFMFSGLGLFLLGVQTVMQSSQGTDNNSDSNSDNDNSDIGTSDDAP